MDFNDHPLTLSFDSKVGFGVIRSIDFPQNKVPSKTHTKCENRRSLCSVVYKSGAKLFISWAPKVSFWLERGRRWRKYVLMFLSGRDFDKFFWPKYHLLLKQNGAETCQGWQRMVWRENYEKHNILWGRQALFLPIVKAMVSQTAFSLERVSISKLLPSLSWLFLLSRFKYSLIFQIGFELSEKAMGFKC